MNDQRLRVVAKIAPILDLLYFEGIQISALFACSASPSIPHWRKSIDYFSTDHFLL